MTRKLKSTQPFKAVIVGIDPGQKGGASVWLNGKYVTSRAVDTRQDRYLILRRAAALAEAETCPMILVFETWTAHGKINTAALIGLGTSVGRWLEAAETFENLVGNWRGPKSTRVQVGQWRRDIFGNGWGNWPTDAWKLAAMNRAELIMGKPPATPDQAEAVLIGFWGTHAGEVGAVLPKHIREAAA